ncbi:hypothetical protein CALVIDRAFT_532390, partial [Calocera viscosa TUFC12733]
MNSDLIMSDGSKLFGFRAQSSKSGHRHVAGLKKEVAAPFPRRKLAAAQDKRQRVS